jgi:hypothetical protein
MGDDGTLDDLHGDVRDPKNLDAPEPRPGFVQRWIRYANADSDDIQNYQLSMRKGWRPRPIESIPQSFKDYPTVDHSSPSGTFAVAGLVLCEMPEQLAARRRRAVKQRTAALNLSVADQTEGASNSGRARGYGGIQRKENIRVTGRRVPAYQAD